MDNAPKGESEHVSSNLSEDLSKARETLEQLGPTNSSNAAEQLAVAQEVIEKAQEHLEFAKEVISDTKEALQKDKPNGSSESEASG